MHHFPGIIDGKNSFPFPHTPSEYILLQAFLPWKNCLHTVNNLLSKLFEESPMLIGLGDDWDHKNYGCQLLYPDAFCPLWSLHKCLPGTSLASSRSVQLLDPSVGQPGTYWQKSHLRPGVSSTLKHKLTAWYLN